MRRKKPRAKAPAAAPGYLDRESGGWKKKWKNKLPVALIYPNTYSVGMSNLGFQLVYSLLNHNPDIVAERVFFPDNASRPLSIESGRPLDDFPILLFSVSFEDDYIRLARLLEMAGLQPLAEDRRSAGAGSPFPASGNPLVMAGGVATFINPEPLAPFIDLFMIGEAEPVLPGIMDFLLEKYDAGDRDVLLELSGTYPGLYAPEFYEFQYNPDGSVASFTGRSGLSDRIEKIHLSDPGPAVGHSQILSPDAEFANLYMTELGRGCSRGCRFCAAGFVYRPPRLWSAEAIINGLAERSENVDRVGLLGMEMARSDDLVQVAGYLLENSCSLSFSSLRADVISPTLLDLLKKSGLKSAAIAPDGGSERLRRVINKGISENDLLAAAESLVRAGVMNLKLYFMVGLPTEEQDDLAELVDLTLKIKKNILAYGRSRGRLSDMLLSVNCFIPKPWTPFQYHPFAAVGLLKEKIKYIRKQLAGQANVRISAERPENAFYQAVLARGDRRVGKTLAKMTGPDAKRWRRVFKAQGIKPEDYAMRQRGRQEVFPWDIIDHGIDRNYLWAEYQKALKGKTTQACETDTCKRCGVCNAR